jgi:ABC-type glycerol-3-phosphate transport system substrate-binding protein
MLWRKLLLLILCGLWLFGCRREQGTVVEPVVTPTAPLNAPSPTSASAETPAPAPAETATAPLQTVLTVWTPLDISPRPEVPGGFALAEQLAAFEQAHPTIRLEVQQKAVTGQGGILSYLRTGRQVAPTVLPDLIILPTDQLAVATTEKLIYPLGNLMPADFVEDLYPVAQSLTRIDNTLVAYPFAVTNLQHLAYNRSVITETLPLTWGELTQVDDAQLVFAAAGSEGAELVLQIYLALGGTLTNELNQPHLDVEPLYAALNQLNRARATGLIQSQSNIAATLTEAWQIFQTGQASLAHTKASLFLRERALGVNEGYAAIPGPDTSLTPIVRGWAWAIATPEPARQALAVELIAWLSASANLGTWSAQSYTLPARRSAFAYWPEDDYIEFLQQQLEHAEPYPAGAGAVVMTALGNAIFDVITLSESPRTAAEQAAAEVRP